MKDKAGKVNSWVAGGGLLTGMGIGFFFIETSALVFLGCMFIGLGLGLLSAAVLSKIVTRGLS
jgi:Na+/phosphate symporter